MSHPHTGQEDQERPDMCVGHCDIVGTYQEDPDSVDHMDMCVGLCDPGRLGWSGPSRHVCPSEYYYMHVCTSPIQFQQEYCKATLVSFKLAELSITK